MVNPYGGQYIVLSYIESITVLKPYCWLILYILYKGRLCNIGNIYQLKLLGTSILCIFLYFHTKCEV